MGQAPVAGLAAVRPANEGPVQVTAAPGRATLELAPGVVARQVLPGWRAQVGWSLGLDGIGAQGPRVVAQALVLVRAVQAVVQALALVGAAQAEVRPGAGRRETQADTQVGSGRTTGPGAGAGPRAAVSGALVPEQGLSVPGGRTTPGGTIPGRSIPGRSIPGGTVADGTRPGQGSPVRMHEGRSTAPLVVTTRQGVALQLVLATGKDAMTRPLAAGGRTRQEQRGSVPMVAGPPLDARDPVLPPRTDERAGSARRQALLAASSHATLGRAMPEARDMAVLPVPGRRDQATDRVIASRGQRTDRHDNRGAGPATVLAGHYGATGQRTHAPNRRAEIAARRARDSGGPGRRAGATGEANRRARGTGGASRRARATAEASRRARATAVPRR